MKEPRSFYTDASSAIKRYGRNTYKFLTKESWPEIDLSQKAQSLFAEASTKFPASTVAQAGFIAENCLDSNMYYPRNLRAALISNKKALELLVKVANSAHRNNDTPIMVSLPSVMSIVNTDFRLAEMMMILDKSELQGVQADYSTYGPPYYKIDEHRNKVVNQLIKKIKSGA